MFFCVEMWQKWIVQERQIWKQHADVLGQRLDTAAVIMNDDIEMILLVF